MSLTSRLWFGKRSLLPPMTAPLHSVIFIVPILASIVVLGFVIPFDHSSQGTNTSSSSVVWA
jgi:hypothetical protein